VRKWCKMGCGGKRAENSPQGRRFLPPFHRYLQEILADKVDTANKEMAKEHLNNLNSSDVNVGQESDVSRLKVSWSYFVT
jgi:hypothetical protein